MTAVPRLASVLDRLTGRCSDGRRFTRRTLPAGRLLFGADEENGGFALLILTEGRLRCFSSFEDRELTLFEMEAGGVVGLHPDSLFEARRHSEVVILDGADFRRLASVDPEFAVATLSVVDHLLQTSIRLAEDLAFHNVRHRVIRVLCDVAEREGRPGPPGVVVHAVPGTEDFAARVGTSRQSVSTVFAGLARDGLVRRAGLRSLVIHDLDRLRNELATAS